MKELEGVSVSGSGNLESQGTFTCDFLDLNVSGSGNLQFDAKANEIEANISGSGNMRLSGKSEAVDMVISGSGRLRASDLVADRYSVRISGSGNCDIHVNSVLDARITGSGTIRYSGNPEKVYNKSTGRGSIRKVN